MDVNRNGLADILEKSPKHVGDLITQGMPTSGGGGRGKAISINTKEAVDWLTEREVSKQIGDLQAENGPIEGTKDGEDLLLTMAKRRKADVDAKKAEEKVIDLEDLGQFMYAISSLYASELNGLGARLAPEVAGIDDPAQCKNRIDIECRRIRSATADRIYNFVDEYLAEQRSNVECETDEECGEVGD
ncbi:terminase small subunit [Shewanella surugensis]|uniref:Terminase small subunit n=1 Tax=Shewanella surugensis TaxID=212020 RepID=A0ABT0L983_9GAMM|nr:terminase small subunit [Shewanella surugensis]MCL1124228.1 terminase small subunit [Shewanella surugensis]